MVFPVSFGVCAHNEQDTIKTALEAILKQNTRLGEIKEVVVVSSESTDKTNQIVEELYKKDSRVKLVIQDKKEGKASAVNKYLSTASGDILVLASADIKLEDNTLNSLLEPFTNPSVGMVTGRPIPNNKPETFMGYTIQLIWRLHHQLQLTQPKANEILAMRPLVKRIDKKTAVDDLQLEALMKEKGYLIVYRPDALVTNHGPETINDLIKQRKRIIIGYLHSRDTKDYVPVTMDKIKVLSVLLNNLTLNPKKLAWTIAAVAIEVYIRLNANIDYYILKRNPYNWEIAETTKKLEDG